jgi:hypothetical protein
MLCWDVGSRQAGPKQHITHVCNRAPMRLFATLDVSCYYSKTIFSRLSGPPEQLS